MILYRVVTYVLRDAPQFGLMPGYSILGLRLATRWEFENKKVDHVLKTWPEFWKAVSDQEKTFELRKDDREPRFEAGQLLELVRFESTPPAPPKKETP